MVAVTDRYTHRMVRSGIVNLVEQATDLALIMPRSTSFELNDGLGSNEAITELDNQGYETKVANNHSVRQPTLNLTYKSRNLDITALQLNRKIEMAEVSLRYPGRQQIKREQYEGANDGKLGNKVKKDVACFASILDNDTGATIKLTQQLFDSFNPSIPNSFAVGDRYQRKFSSDLVAAKNWALLLPEADMMARSLSEGLIGFISMYALCFLSDNAVEIVQADDCFVNPEGGGLKSGDTTVSLDISGLGKCQPWNVYELNEQSFCER